MAQSYRALVATLTAHIREEVLAGAGAALLQVWACRDLEEGIVLSTQGLPYFLLGDGDELALFRYMSTKHCFPLGEALGQGTPASVFHNRQGCAIVDLAALDAADCPRADCAGACAAHSVLLLPLLDRMMGMKGEPLAVLEVVLSRRDPGMLCTLHALLQAGALSAGYAFPGLGEGAAGAPSPRSVAGPQQPPPAALRALLSRPVQGLGGLGGPGTIVPGHDDDGMMEEDEPSGGSGGARDARGAPGHSSGRPPAARGGRRPARSASDDECSEAGSEDPDADPGDDASRGGGACRLTLRDLQAQFGHGVKDAARNLGVCVTTLKRSCRRLGIRRWPRRQLVKLQRALAEVGTVGDSIRPGAGPAGAGGAPGAGGGGGRAAAGGDARGGGGGHLGNGMAHASAAAAVRAGAYGALHPGSHASLASLASSLVAGLPPVPAPGGGAHLAVGDARRGPGAPTGDLGARGSALSVSASRRPRRAAAAAAQSRLAAAAVDDTAGTPPRSQGRRRVGGEPTCGSASPPPPPPPSAGDEIAAAQRAGGADTPGTPRSLLGSVPSVDEGLACHPDAGPAGGGEPAHVPLYPGMALALSPGPQGPLPRGDDCDADLWAAAASALGITPPRLMSGRRTAMFVPGGWNDGVGAGLDGLGLELLGAHSPLRAGGL
ncbi:hypothetical protein ACKKBF_B13330 [Auxenochlorella protothecoides x Auxenochlorella symbiontica]